MAGVKGQQTRGRQPIAPETHLLRGTFQPSRHAGHTVPDAPQGTPSPPDPLEPAAQAEWDRMVKRLELTGAISLVDDAAIYQYAKLYAETEAIATTQAETAASIDLLEENLKDIDKDELVAVFQEITKLRQLEARYTTQVRQGRMAIRQYLVEFGLTPSARSRVKLPPAKPQVDPNKERYFGASTRGA